MTAALDPVRVVEAAYQLGRSEEDWLLSLSAALRPLLDAGSGVGAFLFDRQPLQRTRFSKPILLGAEPVLGERLALALSILPESVAAPTLDSPTWLTTVSQALGLGQDFAHHPLAITFGHPFGIRDLAAFKAVEPTGRGLVIAAPLLEISAIDGPSASKWALCAAHVGAALRLRTALERSTASVVDGAEAVLAPDGACANAEGPARTTAARTALRRAVLASEQAKSSQRRMSSQEALETWQALVAGRWSLVEHFESDGKRLLLAHKNDPELPDPRGLSLRERQVVAFAALGHSGQLTAYQLGLTRSTVARHLARAMAKLGVSTRAELLQRVRGGSANEPSASHLQKPTPHLARKAPRS